MIAELRSALLKVREANAEMDRRIQENDRVSAASHSQTAKLLDDLMTELSLAHKRFPSLGKIWQQCPTCGGVLKHDSWCDDPADLV